MELEYAAAATTRSEEHPEVKGLAAALNVLREKAQLSDQALRKVMEDERIVLESRLAETLSRGFGPAHPVVLHLEAQRAAIGALLREESLAEPRKDRQAVLEARRAEVEARLSEELGSGLGRGHPDVLQLEGQLQAVEELLRSESREEALNDMQAMLEARRAEVEATRAGMLTSGLGSGHPDVVQLEEQLKAIEKRLREDSQ